jgi:hypothetical protein
VLHVLAKHHAATTAGERGARAKRRRDKPSRERVDDDE